ncbi:uncharacterized protein Tco025E_05399 [Trypanosoma conorhini]|uniref:Uncharacterized protein n=1 Tax=Trypanosoma conorhini TaxID=83891 RepID=A0A3R7ND36_9TRYP|nr:uncharacterized protein Tco025E_05399 [Trypanosoma conorhini]RNF16819.1 hypothetical protein Tco025E_05399 [Trypanosoma conorhini]
MTCGADYDCRQLPEEQPYRIMRLNRRPAVGPSHQGACGAAEECGGPHTRSSRSSESRSAPSLQVYVAPASETDAPAFPSTPPHVGGDAAVPSQRLHLRGASTTRAVSCHLEGGAALVTDEARLLFAGRGPAPGGACTAMQQHVQLFRDPTATATPPFGDTASTAAAAAAAAGPAHCRRARLEMLRGSGPLW